MASGSDPPPEALLWALSVWPESKDESAPSIAVAPLAGEASGRRYFRLQRADRSILLLVGPNLEENRIYADFGERLGRRLPLPKIREFDEGLGYLLIDDLGEARLDRLLNAPLTQSRPKDSFKSGSKSGEKVEIGEAPEIGPIAPKSAAKAEIDLRDNRDKAKAEMAWAAEFKAKTGLKIPDAAQNEPGRPSQTDQTDQIDQIDQIDQAEDSLKDYPEIAHKDRYGRIQEGSPDIGPRTFFLREREAGRVPRIFLLKNVARLLAKWHLTALNLVKDSPFFSYNPPYDEEFALANEWGYFLKGLALLGLSDSSPELAREGESLCAFPLGPRVLIHRDFQSRNLLFFRGSFWVLDWQGARVGPAAYDLASFLFDPYVSLSDAEKAAAIKAYLSRRDEPGLLESLSRIAPLRLAQAIGAYCHLQSRGLAYGPYVAPALTRVLGVLPKDDSFPRLKAHIQKALALVSQLF
jgi:Ser/Thr protein kinase RdoA (MazF antagonist)